MQKLWNDLAWEEYIAWQNQDRKTLRKINKLISEIERSGGRGLGKAELLKGDFSGYASARIDQKNRLVYRIREIGGVQYIEIVQCGMHYQDR